MTAAWLDGLAFSSVWVAIAAGALCTAASLAMGLDPPLAAIGVAVSGTLVVYNVDRLRDLERDRQTSPRRSAFVQAHFGVLTGVTLAAGAAAGAFALALGLRAFLVLAPVLLLGLLHRRLKRIAYAKAGYITVAWLAVVVGLPAALAGPALGVGWTAAVVGTSLFANAIASNVRDAEAAAKRFGSGPALWTARVSAGIGAALAGLAPASVRPLVAIPLATLAVLVPFRRDERYGLLLVDGALLAGAAVSIAWLW